MINYALLIPQEASMDYQSPDLLKQATCLYNAEQVDAALNVIAQQIEADFADKNPLCLIVMVGGVIFAGQLLPKLVFPLEVDYLHATRYRGQFKGADAMHWFAQPTTSLKGRHILILDDILDAGVTLAEIIKYCEAHEAASVKTAVLVDKDVVKSPDGALKANYAALRAPDAYLFGYGMDCQHYWRNAPGIYALNMK
jgi:hypoxanthine phosphoribosyltransferase